MKSFLETFLICLVACFAGFFLLAMLGGNFWVLLLLAALLLAALVSVLVGQETRLEELEKRIAQLEQEREGSGG